MRKKALEVLTNNIDIYHVFFDKQDEHARNGLHIIIGKIAMSVELGLISFDEMDYYVDEIFKKYSQL